MEKVIKLDEFIRKRNFENNVLPLFKELNFSLQKFINDKDALLIVKTDCFLFIFLTYIEKGIETTLPDMENKLKDINYQPRVSNGEWVVDNVYKMNNEKTKQLFRRVDKNTLEQNIVLKLKEKISE